MKVCTQPRVPDLVIHLWSEDPVKGCGPSLEDGVCFQDSSQPSKDLGDSMMTCFNVSLTFSWVYRLFFYVTYDKPHLHITYFYGLYLFISRPQTENLIRNALNLHILSVAQEESETKRQIIMFAFSDLLLWQIKEAWRPYFFRARGSY